MKKMVGMGDSGKSKPVSQNDALANSNLKGGVAQEGDAKSLQKRFTSHRIGGHDDEDEADDKDDYSNRSEVDSLKYKEVDRFGFVGGNQYTDPQSGSSSVPIEILRMRELKWLEMMENWDKWMSKRFKKVKERCRKGIPDSLRARAWQLLTGSEVSLASNRGRYQGYLQSLGNPACLDEIRKDVSRQYPNHELFMEDDGQGQEDLYSVLMAYSVHDPKVGYCQAQAPLAAVLLTLMPAEQAFWTFQVICEKYLPGYYDAGLEAVQIDSMVLFGLLKKASPIAYKHLKKQKVEPILWMTDWFMCLYSRTLPWPSVLRVWDMFVCEGVKVVFRVALVLVKSVLGTSEQTDRCPTFYDTLDRLRKIPQECMEENYLARETAKLQITERDMEREHELQLKKWNAAKAQKLQRNNSCHVDVPALKAKDSTEGSDPAPCDSSIGGSEPAPCNPLTAGAPYPPSFDTPDRNGTSEPSPVSTNPKRSNDVPRLQPKPSSVLIPPISLLLPKAANPPLPLTTVEGSERSKTERVSKRFPFPSKQKSKAEKIDLMPGSSRGPSEPSAARGGFRPEAPYPSPCASLSTVTQLRSDERRRTFRNFWQKAKASKSMTHVDL